MSAERTLGGEWSERVVREYPVVVIGAGPYGLAVAARHITRRLAGSARLPEIAQVPRLVPSHS
jgi:hypothetical protein